MLSDVTAIWQLYFGLLFIVVVMFAPNGIAGLLAMHEPLWRAGVLHRLVPAYLVALVPLAVMIARRDPRRSRWRIASRRSASDGPDMAFLRIPLDVTRPLPWLVAAAMMVGGFLLFRRTWPIVASAWNEATIAARGTRGARYERARDRARRRREALRAHRDHPRRQSRDPGRRAPRHHRSERRRQVDAVQPDQRPLRPERRRRSGSRARTSPALRPFEINRRGLSRSFQVTNIFPRLSRLGERALRRAVVARLPLLVLARHRCACRGARADREHPRADQPPAAPAGAGRRAHLCRAARARDRHHHRERRRDHPARRADRRHEPQRGRPGGGADPRRHARQDARHRRARHGGRVRSRRPHLGPGLRRDHRQRRAGEDQGQHRPCRRPISARCRHERDARGRATSTPITARATSCRASTFAVGEGEIV